MKLVSRVGVKWIGGQTHNFICHSELKTLKPGGGGLSREPYPRTERVLALRDLHARARGGLFDEVSSTRAKALIMDPSQLIPPKSGLVKIPKYLPIHSSWKFFRSGMSRARNCPIILRLKSLRSIDATMPTHLEDLRDKRVAFLKSSKSLKRILRLFKFFREAPMSSAQAYTWPTPGILMHFYRVGRGRWPWRGGCLIKGILVGLNILQRRAYGNIVNTSHSFTITIQDFERTKEALKDFNRKRNSPWKGCSKIT